MDSTKREELEKACRKEKDSRVVLRMVAVHVVFSGTIITSTTCLLVVAARVSGDRDK